MLVVCIGSALADANPFGELIELHGTTADAITKALMECLERHFTEDFFDQCLGSFACAGASVMIGKRVGAASQRCSKFPGIHRYCLSHRLERAVGDVVKEVSGINPFLIFFDKVCSLNHVSPKNQGQLGQCAQELGQRLLTIGHVLSIRLLASSERRVRAVCLNYRVLHDDQSSKAADDISRDSRDGAKYKRLDDVLTSAASVSTLGLMYDALTELSDLL